MTATVAAVILAGGQGTRVRHLLPDLPKPMAPVAGQPFLAWVCRYLQTQGIARVAISSGFRAAAIAGHFHAHPVAGMTITCHAEPTPLGTAGGFLFAAEQTQPRPDAWLVLNGDSLVFADLAPLLAAVGPAAAAAALLGLRVPDAARYGTLAVGPGGALAGFAEKRPGAGLINAGVYAFRAEALARFPATRPLSFETAVFPALLAAGLDLRVCQTDAPFLDIGTPETLAMAETFILENRSRLGQP